MFLPISFETLTSTGFLKGVTVDKIKIDDKLSFENVLLGLTNQPFALEETNLILHSSYQKELQKN